MINQKYFILGVEFSKQHFDVALLLDEGKRESKKFPNTQKVFKELSDWLAIRQIICSLSGSD